MRGRCAGHEGEDEQHPRMPRSGWSEGLRSVLEGENGIRVVGEASSAEEALALSRKLRPGVVVLDNRLPNRDGLTGSGSPAVDRDRA